MISLDGWLNAFATFFVTIDPPGMAAIFLGLDGRPFQRRNGRRSHGAARPPACRSS